MITKYRIKQLRNVYDDPKGAVNGSHEDCNFGDAVENLLLMMKEVVRLQNLCDKAGVVYR